MSLGNRMKHYEKTNSPTLISRIPVIIRLDGRCFHTYCQQFKKPWDRNLIMMFHKAAQETLKEIQGAKIAYLQSDEISILVTDYDSIYSAPHFNYDGYKITSTTAASYSTYFYQAFLNYMIDTIESDNKLGKIPRIRQVINQKPPTMDSRVYNLPESEICNYFIWRQQDWIRNSIQMLGRSLFSQKELDNKKTEEVINMCISKGKNWNHLPTIIKRGRCIVKEKEDWVLDTNIPIFTQDRNYIERLLETNVRN